MAEARSRLGISHAELARRVDTAASHISMLERGRTGASLENTSGIARELKVSVDYLFGFTEDPTPAADLQHELKEKKAEIHDLRAGAARRNRARRRGRNTSASPRSTRPPASAPASRTSS